MDTYISICHKYILVGKQFPSIHSKGFSFVFRCLCLVVYSSYLPYRQFHMHSHIRRHIYLNVASLGKSGISTSASLFKGVLFLYYSVWNYISRYRIATLLSFQPRSTINYAFSSWNDNFSRSLHSNLPASSEIGANPAFRTFIIKD